MNTQHLTTVIFFGIQGSGKGTQARILKTYLEEHTNRKTLYLETGQLLRDFAAQGGYSNTLVREVISQGGLLPSFMPMYVLGEMMSKQFSGNEHLIFDGAARRENQAAMIHSMLQLYQRTPYHVINLQIDEELAIERMLNRGREDDTCEDIKKRITWTREHEQKIINMFHEFDCEVHTIDGSQDLDIVHEQIRNALEI